jgi:DNA-directed RNA polymerase specialized sigma24 family protein
MNRKEKVASLLAALDQKRSVAVRFVGRRGRRDDDDLADMAMDEAAKRIRKRAWRNFKPSLGTPKAYVGTIVRRASSFLIKKLDKQFPLEGDVDTGTDDFNPAEIIIRREEIADAHKALQQLSARDRKLLLRWAKRRKKRDGRGASHENSSRNVAVFRAKDHFLRELLTIRAIRIRSSK